MSATASEVTLIHSNYVDSAGFGGNPFDLDDSAAYAAWRLLKLDSAPKGANDLLMPFASLQPTDAELQQLAGKLSRFNMAIYQMPLDNIAEKTVIRTLGRRLGLERLDGNLCADEDEISSLQVRDGGRHGEYIPYSDKGLSWHTDGYYNRPEQQVRGIVLHCVQDAGEGGDSFLFDHEMAYLLLRDLNPDYVAALMAPTAMTIPANVEQGVEIRPEQSGPVFSVMENGRLHMRYTARLRNIVWAADDLTQHAVKALRQLMEEADDYILRHHLLPGQGLICNNVLHGRTAFSNHTALGKERLLYRARYYDRVAEPAALSQL